MPNDACSYCLLLRNGQSIQVNAANPNGDEIEFLSAARLDAPQNAWLQRSSDGETLEIRIVTVAHDASGSWRYTARLDAQAAPSGAKSDKRAWSFMRRK